MEMMFAGSMVDGVVELLKRSMCRGYESDFDQLDTCIVHDSGISREGVFLCST